MSVKRIYRGQGFGTRMLKALEGKAESLQYHKIVLETNKHWESAVNLYKSNGYIEESEEDEFILLYKVL